MPVFSRSFYPVVPIMTRIVWLNDRNWESRDCRPSAKQSCGISLNDHFTQLLKFWAQCDHTWRTTCVSLGYGEDRNVEYVTLLGSTLLPSLWEYMFYPAHTIFQCDLDFGFRTFVRNAVGFCSIPAVIQKIHFTMHRNMKGTPGCWLTKAALCVLRIALLQHNPEEQHDIGNGHCCFNESPCGCFLCVPTHFKTFLQNWIWSIVQN